MSQNSAKKISVPKELVQSLKGKSYSASKIKPGQMKYSTESKERSGEEVKKDILKGQI